LTVTDYDYVDTDRQFAEVVSALRNAEAYAVDTEFHRERTYYPRVALVQLKWDDRLVIVDPLAVDLAPFAAVLDGPGVAVMHAAAQDLEVLDRACETGPTVLFDTQVAAGFVGMRSPSLAALHERLLGQRLPKGDRLTDWLRRPLETRQLDYAASDVRHLLEIRERLAEQLADRGRLDWTAAECEQLRVRGRAMRAPDDAWLKIKETRHLRGKARGVARAVAAWRERVAIENDIPPRFVLSDLGVVAVSQRAPTTADELRKIRGVEDRHAKGVQGEALLDAVQIGLSDGSPPHQGANGRRDQASLRPAASLLSAWLAQHAADLDLDPALLGTRADLEALLRGDESRLSSGWRADLAGQPIKRLVAGDASLAFEKGGGLVLEERSRLPIEPT